MGKKLVEFLDGYEGMLPILKVELLRMGVRFETFRKFAYKYNTEEISFDIDEFEGVKYIMMEGIIPLGDNAKLTVIDTFKMCAEMQYEEDTSDKAKTYMIGNPTYIVRKDKEVVYFRVDLPFSKECLKVMGDSDFFEKYLSIISEG